MSDPTSPQQHAPTPTTHWGPSAPWWKRWLRQRVLFIDPWWLANADRWEWLRGQLRIERGDPIWPALMAKEIGPWRRFGQYLEDRRVVVIDQEIERLEEQIRCLRAEREEAIGGQ